MTRHFLFAPVFTMLALQSAPAADFATQVMEATFKLFDPASVSTCFLVRRDEPDCACYLVTAAHSLENIKNDTAIIVLCRKLADGSFERLDHKVAIRRAGKPIWFKHPTQDTAVLRLAEALPISVPALSFHFIADEAQLAASQVHVASPLYVLTFPQRFEGNAAGFPIARKGIFATPPLLPAQSYPTFFADFTTFAGDSGGPVFVEGGDASPLIVGIAVAQSYHEDRIKSEFEERLVRHPLGLGTVVHARFIRETLEAAAAAPMP